MLTRRYWFTGADLREFFNLTPEKIRQLINDGLPALTPKGLKVVDRENVNFVPAISKSEYVELSVELILRKYNEDLKSQMGELSDEMKEAFRQNAEKGYRAKLVPDESFPLDCEAFDFSSGVDDLIFVTSDLKQIHRNEFKQLFMSKKEISKESTQTYINKVFGKKRWLSPEDIISTLQLQNFELIKFFKIGLVAYNGSVKIVYNRFTPFVFIKTLESTYNYFFVDNNIAVKDDSGRKLSKLEARDYLLKKTPPIMQFNEAINVKFINFDIINCNKMEKWLIKVDDLFVFACETEEFYRLLEIAACGPQKVFSNPRLQEIFEEGYYKRKAEIENMGTHLPKPSEKEMKIVEELQAHIAVLETDKQNLTQENELLKQEVERLKTQTEDADAKPNITKRQENAAANWEIDVEVATIMTAENISKGAEKGRKSEGQHKGRWKELQIEKGNATEDCDEPRKKGFAAFRRGLPAEYKKGESD